MKNDSGLNVLNPNHPSVAGLTSSEYMKLLVLALNVLGVREVVIPVKYMVNINMDDNALCIKNDKNAIILSLVTIKEGKRLAAKEGGKPH